MYCINVDNRLDIFSVVLNLNRIILLLKRLECLIAILDRDIQCDFSSEFWEESKCNWKNSQATMTALSLGTVSRFKWVDTSSATSGRMIVVMINI